MDSNRYRDAVKNVIEAYAKLRPSHGDIRLDVVFDDEHGRYALMQTGWDRGRRVRGNLIYVTLQNNKIFIEYDGMEHSIVDDLIDAGVVEGDIVLAFMADEPFATVA